MPHFNGVFLLLESGFIYAIAPYTTVEEYWAENDAGKFLIKENYTSAEHLYAMGGSAGGLLMGAVINMEPKLFNGIVAQTIRTFMAYYKFNWLATNGWPQYEQLQEVPELKPNEQSILMRKSIVQYFIDEGLFDE
ncbi:hypothetical protein FQR65_LT19887 [Abscondita terminalis]|nr:hypothetical protein FQR65_LT19887 [Abscondita terminalis]